MVSAYTGSQVRAAEGPLLDRGEGPALMARAAHGLALAILRELQRAGGVYGRRVAAVVGKGNNGGDALFALAELARRGVRTTAVLAGRTAHADGLAAFTAAGGRVTEGLEPADAVVDAVLGTGFSGEFRPPLPRPSGTVVACDLPSGVDADTGAAGAAVWRADVTVTFGALKTGLLVGRGRELAGRVEVVNIGLGPHLPEPDVRSLDAAEAAALLPEPRDDWQKYSRGVLGLVAGSEDFPGAAVLSTAGALATGVGMVRLVAPDAVRQLVLAAHPEIVGSPEPRGRVQAWAVGPGIADDGGQRRALAVALGSGLPTVVDASGLEALLEFLAADPGSRGSAAEPRLGEVLARLAEEGTVAGEHIVLTPHAGELESLLANFISGGDAPSRAAIEAQPLRWAREAARRIGVTVLLKGPATVAAAPDGTALVQGAGHPYLATAGSGDTLTGILGALLATAAHPDAPDAVRAVELAALAACIHQTVGRLAAEGGPFGAGALGGAVREAVARLA
ncbi:bifunctional NAD(P)H-hydrate repair enzyme [Sinomonas cyclohexanicum]|uniref:Bifunctional NAD(P)H-hydrate repair enzyme n=1 Tax=Sinomonas cyclohexanicum TaxID=322009 RepID=A0ABN6FK69_SINCY|nr:bifunctional ADP-dependent NAD(P)H-hydrate dehydratase/NAD(P)H-hydrate epimerase [Corynebacterium cyclohexanicum]BCT77081.1 bifunctional NAD(P)H-hydrate repair enzyme [Corynebacterium cyclohexanicum]